MQTILEMQPFAQGIIAIIILLFLCTIIFSSIIKSTYSRLINDIKDKENRKNRLFKFKIINNVVDDFNNALNSNIDEINTVAIIEKNIHGEMKKISLGERFIVKAVSMMIILGLLGTFYGLILSIKELVTMLSETQQTVGVEAITSGLINSIQGMSVAFITSMFGIGASILANLLSISFGLNDSKESFIVHIEEYLDNTLMVSKNGLGGVDSNGNTALSLSFDKFNESLTTNLRSLTNEISQKMGEATSDMVLTAEALQNSVVKFDGALNRFADNTRDFTEFNHHLKTNIQRLTIGFDDFHNEIRSNVDIMKEGYEKVEELKNKLNQVTKTTV